jgi:hypothetical protein
MLRARFWAILVFLVGAACAGGDEGGGGGGGSGDGGTEPVGKTAITIQNNTRLTMQEVAWATCAAATYGDDVLTGTVGPEQTFTFELPQGGCYDVIVSLVDTSNFLYIAERTGIQIETGQTVTVSVNNETVIPVNNESVR